MVTFTLMIDTVMLLESYLDGSYSGVPAGNSPMTHFEDIPLVEFVYLTSIY